MTPEKTITEAKNYLIYVHDSLRRAYRYGGEGKELVDTVMADIEKTVTQLETVEEMQRNSKNKTTETITEE